MRKFDGMSRNAHDERRDPVFTTISLLITALVSIGVIHINTEANLGFGILAQRPITIALLASGMVANGVAGGIASTRRERGDRVGQACCMLCFFALFGFLVAYR